MLDAPSAQREDGRVSPLAKYRIVEFARPGSSRMQELALAMAGRIAADLGAQVTRVFLSTPAEVEHSEHRKSEDSFLHVGKRVVSLHGQVAEFQATINAADAVLTNDPNLVPATNELADLTTVTCLLSDFPLGDERNDVPQSELVMLARSGMLYIVGEPDREPLMLAGHQPAYAAGFAMYSALAVGLEGLRSDGEGDIYDVCILDVLAWINWKAVAVHELGEANDVNREGRNSEWRVVRAKDGWIALVFNQKDWPSLVDLIGDPYLAHPDLTTRSGRARLREKYMAIIDDWCASRTREEIRQLAQAKRIPIGPVLAPSELKTAPQVVARGAIIEAIDLEGAPFCRPVLPCAWNGKALYRT